MATYLTQEQAMNIDRDSVAQFARDKIKDISEANHGDLTPEELLAAEEAQRCLSPNDEWIHGFNEREDSEEVWRVYEEELNDTAEGEGLDPDLVLTEDEAEERFAESLEESHVVKVCGHTFSPIDVLRGLDYVAFKEEFENFKES